MPDPVVALMSTAIVLGTMTLWLWLWLQAQHRRSEATLAYRRLSEQTADDQARLREQLAGLTERVVAIQKLLLDAE